MEIIHTGGAAIPALGLGTYELKGKTATHQVRKAIEMGYRHIDTAQMYGNEEQVGEGIRQSGIDQGAVFVTTKVWPDKLTDAQTFADSVEESLEKLGMDYVDLLLIHWPHTKLPVDHYIDFLREAKRSGYTRFVGVSNFTIDQMRDALYRRVPIIMNQVEYHPLLDQSKLLSFCSENNIAVTAYSPLAQGKVMEEALLQKIGKQYGKSAAQISLRWLVQQVNVLSIPRTTSEKHLQSNMNIFDFKLSEEDMEALFELSQKRTRLVHPSFAPEWD